jgi:hypothetical protein
MCGDKKWEKRYADDGGYGDEFQQTLIHEID